MFTRAAKPKAAFHGWNDMKPTPKADQLRALRERAAEAAERSNAATQKRIDKRAAKKAKRK